MINNERERSPLSVFSNVGRQLVKDLEDLSHNYHVKSDSHDILLYEAAVVNARMQRVLQQKELPENLSDSCLLSDWGKSLRPKIPSMVERVTYFHELYDSLVSD